MRNKRLVVALSLLCVAILGGSGCGNKETSGTPVTTETVNQTDEAVSVEENKVPDDDFVISWQDEGLTRLMREITGIVEGNMYYEHIKDIKELDIEYVKHPDRLEWYEVKNTSSLKYLTNLEYLILDNFGGEVVEVIGLKKLTEISGAYSPIHFVDMKGQTVIVDEVEVYIDSNDFTYVGE